MTMEGQKINSALKGKERMDNILVAKESKLGLGLQERADKVLEKVRGRLNNHNEMMEQIDAATDLLEKHNWVWENISEEEFGQIVKENNAVHDEGVLLALCKLLVEQKYKSN